MEKTGGSRLLQMQARFQQKQLQEREMKIASLYEAQQARALDRVRHSSGSGASASPPTQPTPPPVSHQPGKVRQMFEERRTKAGIDKSYPLQPIHNTDRTQQRKTMPNGYNRVTNASRTVERKTTKTHVSNSLHSIKKHTVAKVEKVDNMVHGSGDLNHNHELDLNTIKLAARTNGDSSELNDNLAKPPIDEFDNAENNYLIENETFPEALAPATTPRTPTAPAPVVKKQEQKQQKRSPAPRQSKSPAKLKPQLPAAASPRRSATTASAADKSGQSRRGGSADGASCAVCGRHFAADRLAKHQDICRKTSTKKRKPYDVLKHRLAGTEAEPFINSLRKNKVAPATGKLTKPQANWRLKHEEFIQAIRAAKQVQAHLNAGGKLSDLPPPPPSHNPDYVQCPHCNRRFNQAAAERHIPKCANFQFNKPKPAPKRREMNFAVCCFSLENFLLRMCLAALAYYSLCALISALEEYACSRAGPPDAELLPDIINDEFL